MCNGIYSPHRCMYVTRFVLYNMQVFFLRGNVCFLFSDYVALTDTVQVYSPHLHISQYSIKRKYYLRDIDKVCELQNVMQYNVTSFFPISINTMCYQEGVLNYIHA